MGSGGKLEKELATWKGFPWALRKEDLQAWNEMVEEVRTRFADAIENSGKTFAVYPFFMALIVVQQGMIKELRRKLAELGAEEPPRERPSVLDEWVE